MTQDTINSEHRVEERAKRNNTRVRDVGKDAVLRRPDFDTVGCVAISDESGVNFKACLRVEGKVNGRHSKLMIDTGATAAVVPKSLVKWHDLQETGGKKLRNSDGSELRTIGSAIVTIETEGGLKAQVLAYVVEDLPGGVLVGYPTILEYGLQNFLSRKVVSELCEGKEGDVRSDEEIFADCFERDESAGAAAISERRGKSDLVSVRKDESFDSSTREKRNGSDDGKQETVGNFINIQQCEEQDETGGIFHVFSDSFFKDEIRERPDIVRPKADKIRQERFDCGVDLTEWWESVENIGGMGDIGTVSYKDLEDCADFWEKKNRVGDQKDENYLGKGNVNRECKRERAFVNTKRKRHLVSGLDSKVFRLGLKAVTSDFQVGEPLARNWKSRKKC